MPPICGGVAQYLLECAADHLSRSGRSNACMRLQGCGHACTCCCAWFSCLDSSLLFGSADVTARHAQAEYSKGLPTPLKYILMWRQRRNVQQRFAHTTTEQVQHRLQSYEFKL